jgi:large subunit ribosomal protein L3
MPKISRPRHGSLQFWPRKRAEKLLPSIHWNPIVDRNEGQAGKLLGFIAYKVGMKTAFVKDLTPNSMTKDKKIVMPVTIVEVPGMKVFSIRFYNQGKIVTEVLAQHLDKELQRKVKLPKTHTPRLEEVEKDLTKYDRITILAYALSKKTGIKKSPDMAEIGIGGSVAEQFNAAKALYDKEIKASEHFTYKMVDLRGVTTGRGLTGPIKRYGLELKQHKSEKGRRRPGSLAPWHPARTTYMSPNAGQHGLFTRAIYNNQVIVLSDANKNPSINPNGGFKNYGVVRNEYMIIRGSVQGPSKRSLILTAPLRVKKGQAKKKYEFLDLR